MEGLEVRGFEPGKVTSLPLASTAPARRPADIPPPKVRANKKVIEWNKTLTTLSTTSSAATPSDPTTPPHPSTYPLHAAGATEATNSAPTPRPDLMFPRGSVYYEDLHPPVSKQSTPTADKGKHRGAPYSIPPPIVGRVSKTTFVASSSNLAPAFANFPVRGEERKPTRSLSIDIPAPVQDQSADHHSPSTPTEWGSSPPYASLD